MDQGLDRIRNLYETILAALAEVNQLKNKFLQIELRNGHVYDDNEESWLYLRAAERLFQVSVDLLTELVATVYAFWYQSSPPEDPEQLLRSMDEFDSHTRNRFLELRRMRNELVHKGRITENQFPLDDILAYDALVWILNTAQDVLTALEEILGTCGIYVSQDLADIDDDFLLF